jgi:competence protein ComEC
MTGILATIQRWGNAIVCRHPLFVVAFAAATCVVLARWSLPMGIFLAVGWGFLGALLRDWRLGSVWLLASGLTLGMWSWRTEAQSVAERNLLQQAPGLHEGVLLNNAKGQPSRWSAAVKLTSGEKVQWEGNGDELPVAGSRVRAHGNFSALPTPRNPGEFDRAEWLRNRGIAATFSAHWVKGEVATSPAARLAADFRQGFRTAVTTGLEEDSEEAMVIRAVVIGEPPLDADALVMAFRSSGTLHAFSVSGLHVAMVGSIAWLLLRSLGVPRRWAVLLLLPLIFGYSWLSGNSPPALRSAWMAAVFLGAFVFRRRPDLLNALGAVLLAALLWDARVLFQPGVQLSYGVVAAIAIGAGWGTRCFAWIAKEELYLPPTLMSGPQRAWLWFRRKLAQSLGVSLVAGMGSTPLTAFHFGMITPISVIAGIFLVPLVFVLLAAALISAAFFPILPGAAQWLNCGNAYVAKGCVWTAERFAAIPGGHLQVRHPEVPFVLVYDLEKGAGAACFYAPKEGAVLMDCGDAFQFKSRIVPSLRQLGVFPDSVILSHPDGGHLGGGAAVWEMFPVQQALLPVVKSRSATFRSWVNEAPKSGVRLRFAENTRDLPMPDGARLEVLHAPDSQNQNTLADERVAIFRLHWRGWKILFTSDAGMKTETAALTTGQDFSADLLVAGHNRSDVSLCDAFLDAVNPKAIIASHADFPISEKLEPKIVDYWRSRGIQVMHQGETGGVMVTLDETGALVLEGFADQSRVILTAKSR